MAIEHDGHVFGDAELIAMIASHGDIRRYRGDMVRQLMEENAALRGRVAVLTEALAPFGAVNPGDLMPDNAWFVDGDEQLGRAGWTYGAVRRARATLAAAPDGARMPESGASGEGAG